MPVPARSWPARGSCASGKPGRRCPTCRLRTSRFRTPSKTSGLRSDAPSRQRSRQDASSRQRSRQRSRPVARSRSQSHRVLAVAPPVRRRTARTGERPELLARLKACRAARAETGGLSPPMRQGPSPPRPARRGAAPTDVTRASAFAWLRASPYSTARLPRRTTDVTPMSSMNGRACVKVDVTDRGWLLVPSLTWAGSMSDAFQSSIRSRWADQSVVRGSGAQSSWRPSGWWRPDIGTSSPERAQAGKEGVPGRDAPKWPTTLG